ncbi:LapA family protein [Kocuria sp.]|uniref:LapA family protein n=1 Tax=Kocuria sp. TaxID=1871328 RepID=UPI0026DF55C0|nr:lipopolysaccharide assembly protein LapA domain-containing protein [Kocuria sp.]MDO5617216.1 lipopolysaccharide assembly protein LapA domain-containing protein [Kocuria sp.]
MSQHPAGNTPGQTPWQEPSGQQNPAAGQQPVQNAPASQSPQTPQETRPAENRRRNTSPEAERPVAQDNRAAQPQPELDPALDGRARGGATGATWVALIIGLVLLVLLLVFVLQNMNDVLISYMAWEFNLPLGVAMLLAAVAGGLIMAMVGSIRLIVVTRRLHKLEKERESIKRTLR